MPSASPREAWPQIPELVKYLVQIGTVKSQSDVDIDLKACRTLQVLAQTEDYAKRIVPTGKKIEFFYSIGPAPSLPSIGDFDPPPYSIRGVSIFDPEKPSAIPGDAQIDNNQPYDYSKGGIQYRTKVIVGEDNPNGLITNAEIRMATFNDQAKALDLGIELLSKDVPISAYADGLKKIFDMRSQQDPSKTYVQDALDTPKPSQVPNVDPDTLKDVRSKLLPAPETAPDPASSIPVNPASGQIPPTTPPVPSPSSDSLSVEAQFTSTSALRGHESAAAPADDPEAAVRAELASKSASFFSAFNACLNRLAPPPASPPPPPPARDLGPGLDFDLKKFQSLAGTIPESKESGLTAAFSALIEASNLGTYYGDLISSGYDERRIARAMLLYGQYLYEAPISVGDIVLISAPLAANGEFWGVATSASDASGGFSVLVSKGDSATFELRQAQCGDLLRAWRPTPVPIFSRASPYGQFWGPNLAKLVKLLDSSLLTHDEMLNLLFSNTRYAADNARALINRLSAGFYMISEATPIFPGTVLFNIMDDDMAVFLQDRMLYGVCGSVSGCATMLSWEQFRPRFVWYPMP